MFGFSQPVDDFVFCARIAVTAVLDCLRPTAMDWYFRSPLQAKFLRTSSANTGNDPQASSPVIKIALYRLGSTLVALVYLLARAIKRKDGQFTSKVETISGVLGIL